MSYGQIKTSFMEIYEELSNTYTLLEESTDPNELPDGPGIYCIIFDAKDSDGNAVEKKYVGLATKISERIEEHKKAARPGGRDYLVYNAMRKYPYKVIVLEECPVEQLNAKEQKWIAELHTYMDDTKDDAKIKKVSFKGQTYNLKCTGPGYNMTLGGEGTLHYKPEIIDEILSLYKECNYNHTETIVLFREKYKDNKYLKLCHDTLKHIVDSEKLPWKNELEKTTIVYANMFITEKRITKDRPNGRTYYNYAPNTTDPKYRKVCKSQADADRLVKVVGARLQKDLGHILNEIKAKHDNRNPGAYCIKWLLENNLYDKYLDLAQYDMTKISAGINKSEESSRRGKNDRNPEVHESCYSTLVSYYNVSEDFKLS
jgi:hypothetical protein